MFFIVLEYRTSEVCNSHCCLFSETMRRPRLLPRIHSTPWTPRRYGATASSLNKRAPRKRKSMASGKTGSNLRQNPVPSPQEPPSRQTRLTVEPEHTTNTAPKNPGKHLLDHIPPSLWVVHADRNPDPEDFHRTGSSANDTALPLAKTTGCTITEEPVGTTSTTSLVVTPRPPTRPHSQDMVYPEGMYQDLRVMMKRRMCTNVS